MASGLSRRADVERIARLARLELTDDEKTLIAPQLASFLAYAEQVQQVATQRRAADLASARRRRPRGATTSRCRRCRATRRSRRRRRPTRRTASSKYHECSADDAARDRAGHRRPRSAAATPSAAEVCRAALDRIAALDDAINAFTDDRRRTLATRAGRGARRAAATIGPRCRCSACPSRSRTTSARAASRTTAARGSSSATCRPTTRPSSSGSSRPAR